MEQVRRAAFRLVAILWGALLLPGLAAADTNSAQGGIGRINNGTLTGGDGTGRAQITINGVDLALVKQARDLAGVVLPDGAPVVPGQEIYFVLFVVNPTAAAAGNLRLVDPLDEAQFLYVANSLEVTEVPNGADDARIWTGPWTPLTDTLGSPDDRASVVDTGGQPGPDRVTIGAIPGQANAPANISGQALLAVRFRVRVQ